MTQASDHLHALTRVIPDFPEPGILFRDLTPVFADGPALAAGHASLAPASASDVGQTAADAVFLGDGLAPVATAIVVSRRTMRVVRQNFALAIGYNALAIPLALAGMVTPLVAALAMSGSSIIVVGNALRLRGASRP